VTKERLLRVKGECVVTSNRITATGGLWRCSYLLELAAGDLMIEGLDPRGPGSSMFAVLGGTEGYPTAAGDAEPRGHTHADRDVPARGGLRTNLRHRSARSWTGSTTRRFWSESSERRPTMKGGNSGKEGGARVLAALRA
jgi:hypothetical protein